MSIEAYVWVTHHAPPVGRNGKPLRPVLRNVLYVLADHAGRNGKEARPSAKTIAGYLNMKKNNVYPLLDQLQEGGWISRGDQRKTAHLPENVRPVVYDLNLSFVRRTDQTPSTADTPSMTDTRSTGEPQGSTAETPGVCAVDLTPSTADTQTVLEPSMNRPEPGGARGTGGTDLTEHTSWRDRRARLCTVGDPDDRSRATARGKDGKDEDETTGTGTAPTSPADGDQDHEQTTTPDGGHVAPGDATEFSPESGRSAERPSEPSDTPDPHTDSVKPGKRPRAVNPRQREATSRMASGHDNEQRKLAGAERARVIAADYHATGDPMATVAARHGVGVGTVHRAVSKFPAPADLPEVSA